MTARYAGMVRRNGWTLSTTFWHADCVRKNSLNAFTERYRKWCKRHGYFFKQSNAAEVYELARSVITLVPKGPGGEGACAGSCKPAHQHFPFCRDLSRRDEPSGLHAARISCWLWDCMALENPLARSLWRKSVMCAALSASRLSLPLLE